MKNLPLGIQTFSKIIDGNYLYIDKTREILNLFSDGNCFFLSRPRRFGKSLLVSTLKEIFLGNRELFKGLYIYDKIPWEKHPVIHIDFSAITYDKSPEIFEASLSRYLTRIAMEYKLTLPQLPIKDQFYELINNLSRENKVVVLIDEYDKPIIDHITEPVKAGVNREILRNFFSVLKNADAYLRFVFLTGVSKFSKVSVFSGLNNILDITLDRRFAVITGITQEELLGYFPEYIDELARCEESDREQLITDIRHWYNGYSWDGETRLYNPTSILSLFTQYNFSNYWFATGTPTFLINLIKKKNFDITELERIQTNANILDSYDLENMDIASLLFQTGYLTIRSIEKIDKESFYNLGLPNREVRNSFYNYLFAAYTDTPVTEISPVYHKLIRSLAKKEVALFQSILVSLFSRIPYNLHIKEERYYHSLCYMILALMGAEINLEVLSDKGRMDGVLVLENSIYVIEFKLGTAGEALAQIKAQRYWEPYLDRGKELYLLGIGGFAEKQIEVLAEKG